MPEPRKSKLSCGCLLGAQWIRFSAALEPRKGNRELGGWRVVVIVINIIARRIFSQSEPTRITNELVSTIIVNDIVIVNDNKSNYWCHMCRIFRRFILVQSYKITSDILVEFRIAVDLEFPGRYAWFAEKSLHCTLRSLDTV